MRSKLVMTCILVGCMATNLTYADDVNTVHPSNTTREAAISFAVKTQLSAENSSSMNNVVVKTNREGVVTLSGSVATQDLVSKAEAITHNVVGVNSINNQIVVKSSH